MLEYTLHDYVKLVLNDHFQKLGENQPSKVYLMVITEVEKALFKSVLDYCENNQSKAAQILGISRGTLRHKLKEYGLDIHTRE